MRYTPNMASLARLWSPGWSLFDCTTAIGAAELRQGVAGPADIRSCSTTRINSARSSG